MLHFVGAYADNYAMGYEKHLPWPRMAADISRFHVLTKNKIVLMGQRTYKEFSDVQKILGTKKIYVATRQKIKLQDAEIISNLELIVEKSKTEDIWVIGGAQIFTQLLPHATSMYITKIEGEFEADTFFPAYDISKWKILKQQTFPADLDNPYPYTFLTLKIATK